MKPIYSFCILAAIITSCGGNQEAIEKENIAVVEKYIKAVESKDTQAMTDLLADNYVGYGPSVADTVNKAQALENWRYVAENLYDKIEYQRTVNIAAKITEGPNPGNFVSDWARLKITYKDGSGPVYLHMNAIYRIENGKITVSRTFYNEADVLRQLGYDFVPFN